MTTFFQARPVLEVRHATSKTWGTYVEDGTEALYVSNNWDECAAFIVGFVRAWDMKEGVCEDCSKPSGEDLAYMLSPAPGYSVKV